MIRKWQSSLILVKLKIIAKKDSFWKKWVFLITVNKNKNWRSLLPWNYSRDLMISAVLLCAYRVRREDSARLIPAFLRHGFRETEEQRRLNYDRFDTWNELIRSVKEQNNQQSSQFKVFTQSHARKCHNFPRNGHEIKWFVPHTSTRGKCKHRTRKTGNSWPH